jgi:hypothetical protein
VETRNAAAIYFRTVPILPEAGRSGHVGEERYQPEHSDELELQLLGLVRHALGQAVQFLQRAFRRPGLLDLDQRNAVDRT